MMAVSISGHKYLAPGESYYEFEGDSIDEKPVGMIDGRKIATGSKFVEWDTGTMYRYDAESETWSAFGGES